MRILSLNNPGKICFGAGSTEHMTEDYLASDVKRIFILSIPPVISMIGKRLDKLRSAGIELHIDTSLNAEPDYDDFNRLLKDARDFQPGSIAGIGGGSVMDMAKIIAAFIDLDRDLDEYAGINLLPGRNTHLVCVPTTSGTGSEVSPNSILMDNKTGAKKGFISPYLVPDASYVDPELTLGLPPGPTAYTGIDALTHCIEAFTNKFAHPVTDMYAREGIRLIIQNLKKAVDHGEDIEARTAVSLGSMYGGMCLGPVNTAAVHALAYPVGSDFKIAHGLSNAVLLPYVMEFNMEMDAGKYEEIGRISREENGRLGEGENGARLRQGYGGQGDAVYGLEMIKKLIEDCGIPLKLREIGIPEDSLEDMAKSALEVKRLLKNNIREVKLEDAINLYKKAY